MILLAYHQSFPIACTSSSGPWKNTLTILLQPVEFDWIRDEEAEADELLLLPPEAVVDDFDDSPVVCFELDGPAVDGDDLESFELVVEVL